MAVHFKDKKLLDRKVQAVRTAGTGSLHIVADFDRTLTKAYVDDRKTHGVFDLLRDYCFSPEQAREEREQCDKYRPYEFDQTLPMEERARYMQEWWEEHLALTVRARISKEKVLSIASRQHRYLREGAKELLKMLANEHVPLLILSAGIGDFIEGMLSTEGALTSNIHIISNFFTYDKDGNVDGYASRIVHSCNKDEGHVRGTAYEHAIGKRRNAILLGDTVDDLKMSKGMPHEQCIRVGFLNEDDENQLGAYLEGYDVVITGDVDMGYVLELLQRIIR